MKPFQSFYINLGARSRLQPASGHFRPYQPASGHFSLLQAISACFRPETGHFRPLQAIFMPFQAIFRPFPAISACFRPLQPVSCHARASAVVYSLLQATSACLRPFQSKCLDESSVFLSRRGRLGCRAQAFVPRLRQNHPSLQSCIMHHTESTSLQRCIMHLHIEKLWVYLHIEKLWVYLHVSGCSV